MKSFKIALTIILLFTSYSNHSQNLHGIKFLGSERNQICQKFNQAFLQRPREVRFSIVKVNASLFFETNDENWFKSLLTSNDDGLAIDIVPKDRYNCGLEAVIDTQIKGFLLEPVYTQELKNGIKKVGNKYRVLVGRIPQGLLNDDLEFNILFLSNQSLCQYYVVYDLEAYPWDLLDMGMYLDSLTYNTRKIKPIEEEGYTIKTKSLKFIIPFEKNKSEYSQKDIKPLYDSLRLTDFNIKSIDIRAYSSVEGFLERNIELQNQRANSIANALQKFQKPTIITHISSSENWVEFLNDIKNTRFKNFQTLSKSDIKAKLVGSTSQGLEPILREHRKAVVQLELERKDKYKNMTTEQLVINFNSALQNEQLDEAIKIQNSIFEKIKGQEASPEVLRKMTIPNQAKYANFMNKNSSFKYLADGLQALIVYNELLELEKIVPKDMKVKYNIVALKLKLWRHKAIDIDETALKNQIYVLKNYKVDNSLISRMMVNYHIIKAENDMRKRDYKNKDISVTYIDNNYSKFTFSDFDYLSLAQFFSYYANTDLSVELLKDKVNTIDVDEDLLFYYLNLTIINTKLTNTTEYRAIMLNAFNMNQERYCKLFNPFGEGGVTFQLLEDEYLRNTYCENCITH
ncbi:hypothetical protein RXV94_01625 [Yeosuana sp. MJ-SS3]|uniref:OmpA-like domain-containing protein n=1 Tax=Gilvirhabdus luticola TaxID=3079858 RepID=A0ABU3U355_9FLAO|nr:hypothetical protein [Yeosuana sp. MJ-SS3]MDU8884840.1 hypothetical protein [Yeosuana sp. MJ-SS3]